MRMSHLAVLVAVILSSATAFAIAQPSQPANTAAAGGSKKVVNQLKKVNSNLQVINSNITTLNNNVGSSTSGTSVRGLLDELNDRTGSSRFSFGTVRGLLDDIEANTSGP
jgi:hypothetical protein